MTISKTVSFVTQNGNDSNTTWPYSFNIPSANEVEVIITDSDGIEGDPLSSSLYTIDGLGSEDGGNVEYPLSGSPLATGEKITIKRVMSTLQSTKIRNQRRYDPQVVEEALDRITLLAQDLSNLINLAVKVPVSSGLDPEDYLATLTTLKSDATAAKVAAEAARDALVLDAGYLAVAADLSGDDTIGTVAADLSGTDTIGTVAGAIANVNAVGADIADVNVVAANLSGSDTIGIVAAIDSDVTTVADNITDLVALAQGTADLINGKVIIPYQAATGNTFAIGDIGYITSNGIVKTNATQESTARGALVMATEAIPGGSTGNFLLRGIQDGLTGITDQANYYLDTSDGDYTTSQPYVSGNTVRIIGTGVGTDSIYFNPSPTYIVVESDTTYPPVIVESSSQGYELNSGSLVLDAPADIETGDYLLLIVSADYTDASTATITPPSGFEELVAYTRVNSGAEGIAMQAWYKIAGSEPTTYTITEDAFQKFGAVMLRISGADPNLQIDVQDTDYDDAGATKPTIPSVTTTVDQTVLISAVHWDGSKTLTTGPSGYTAVEQIDETGYDLYVAQKASSTAGATGASAVDISSNDQWMALIFAFRKQGATAGSIGSEVGPFPLDDDGLGYTVKLTLPVNEAGALSGATDAHEVLCSNSPSYTPGDDQLQTYVNPTYFLRTATAYRMAAPIRPGAYTSSNTNGPARCEFRHERNYGPTERVRFKVTISLVQAAANSKCTCVQIHRVDASPTIKGVIQVDSGGTTWKFRTLVKKSDGASDEALDKDGNDTNAKTGLAFNSDVTIEYDWTPGGDLKIWVNNANTNAPDRWYENVLSSDVASYIKPGGPYPSNKGDGLDSDLWIVDVKDFVLIDDSGNEIART